MWQSKDVYYVSDSTGILITNIGQAVLCQFPEISFQEERFPFVRTVPEAQKVLEKILKQSAGRKPIIFSTIVNPEVREILRSSEVEYFDPLESLLISLEDCLETKALRVPGFSHHINDVMMNKRVEAIHFCLEHDDGQKVSEYNDAEIIILGVSRAGKTPVSVYLATQMGFKAANFPLTSEYLHEYRLPKEITENVKNTVGLTPSPEFLHSVREKRYAGSNYAKMGTCRQEVQEAKQIFMKYKIPVIQSTGKSIEEIATQISQELKLTRI
ncbi:MAG: pyruvate, water dikinase regulatory protein [Thermodesulfobacteriota bacterium]|nr:pyruvate, water dikinase regulatory protein [Thermodesulfobacteriota bacterium]